MREICPGLQPPRRLIFFDLADPEKRTAADILRALELIGRFEACFDVILGLNEKEAREVGDVFGIKPEGGTPEALGDFALLLAARIKAGTLVVHPVSYALAVSGGKAALAQGPFTPKPLITTGAGDHFNSGFCLGRLLGMDNQMSLLTGVTTSGYYVRTAQSPSITQIADLMRPSAP